MNTYAALGKLAWAFAPFAFFTVMGPSDAATLRGQIVDASTGQPVAARVYLQSADGTWHHVESASEAGRAIPYAVRRGDSSVEVHTSLSAHPFVAELPPGTYTLIAERGKEVQPARLSVTLPADGDSPDVLTVHLLRWTDMAAKGWFSGDTHVHRKVSELPILLLAEDLNVALPLTAWVTDSEEAPARANKNPDPIPPPSLIEVDPTHVIWPVNTEYEIFTVGGKSHTLGAVFVLNHKRPFPMAAPPVGPIAEEARRQGALLDLDKHNWPWSIMLMPAMRVHLFELANNHLWRTQFQFTQWYPEYVGDFMDVERKDGAFTERGWIDFGFQTYYALLNCGFDMKPSAGTASGVHPVPLGFGRVYVKIEGPFSYDKWIEGLREGRSFVTTGPMLMVDMTRQDERVRIEGIVESASPLDVVEIVVNGRVQRTLSDDQERTELGAHRLRIETEVPLESSSWIAVRAFERREDERPRFAHSAPVHFTVDGKPLRPSAGEVAYFMKRISDEIERNEDVLGPEAMAEYREALTFFERPRQDGE